MMFGITCKEVRGLAFQMAERNNIPHPFKNGVAGKDWLQGFMSRHPELSLRQPEATSAARAHGFNRQSVNRFFDLLTALVEEHNFPPDKIYNVDETGMTTVQTRPSKIIALRGKRQVGALTSAEKGTLVTTEICMSATGSFVPPMFVWPRVRMKPELMDECPPGSISECHNSGWMQTNIFTIWFQHFVKVSGATTDNKVLLILDGHATHTHNLDVINMARENGVYLLSLPPHCSHKLQPLDVAFMKPLSTYYTQAVETWLRQHPGRRVTVFQLASLFGKAYLKSATAQNAATGLRKTGIYPLDRHIFQDQEFAPAELANPAHQGPNAPARPEADVQRHNAPVRTEADVHRPDAPVRTEADVHRPDAPVRTEADVHRPDAPARPEADVRRHNAPVRTEADVHMPDAPARPEADVQRPNAHVRTKADVHRPDAPVRTEADVQRPNAPVRTKADVHIPNAPVRTKADVHIPNAPVRTKADVHRPNAPVRTKADVQIPNAPVRTKADVPRPNAPVRTEADVHRPDAPARPEADVQRPNAPVRTEADVHIPDAPVRPVADVPGPVPSTSGFISPFVISPPPKMTRTNSSKRKSDRSKSEHLTSSPYKKRLHEVTGEKLQREADKVNRAKVRAEKKLQKEKKSKAAEMSKKKKGKGKSKGKRLRIATPEPESSESGEDETCCLFCCEAYSMSANGGWIQCTTCRRWAHDDCAGIGDDDDTFVCDICA